MAISHRPHFLVYQDVLVLALAQRALRMLALELLQAIAPQTQMSARQ